MPAFLTANRLLPRLKYADGLRPNLLALSYALTGYTAGLLLATSESLVLNLLGTLWLAHAMIIAAYLVHECAHNTIFADNADNARLGKLLNWLTGACYSDYEAIRHKHFRHHVDRADVVAFDYRPIIARHPRLARLIEALEWLYIPAVELMMHLLVILLPFIMDGRKGERGRVLKVLAVRLPLFGMLGWFAPQALLCYAVAYMLMLTVLRFMDAFQHTYEIFETLEHSRGPEAKQFDRAYEDRNTFSNPISVRHSWLDRLTLNFGYHNAHHTRPAHPWYRLPALHKELYGLNDPQVIPFRNQLKAFHRFRVQRALNADVGDIGVLESRGADFVGVDGVSFLTAH